MNVRFLTKQETCVTIGQIGPKNRSIVTFFCRLSHLACDNRSGNSTLRINEKSGKTADCHICHIYLGPYTYKP